MQPIASNTPKPHPHPAEKYKFILESRVPTKVMITPISEILSRRDISKVEKQAQVAATLATRCALGCMTSDTPNPAEVDNIRALELFLQAAAYGDIASQADIGRLFMLGLTKEGIPDYTEALKWLIPAAKAGSIHAHGHLGIMYANGLTEGSESKIENIRQRRAYMHFRQALFIGGAENMLQDTFRRFIRAEIIPGEIKTQYHYLLQLAKNPTLIQDTIEQVPFNISDAQGILKALIYFDQGVMLDKLLHRYVTQFFMKSPFLIATFVEHASIVGKLAFLDRYAACEYDEHNHLIAAVAAIRESLISLPEELTDKQKHAVFFSMFLSEKIHYTNQTLKTKMLECNFQGSFSDFIKTSEGQKAYYGLAFIGIVLNQLLT